VTTPADLLEQAKVLAVTLAVKRSHETQREEGERIDRERDTGEDYTEPRPWEAHFLDALRSLGMDVVERPRGPVGLTGPMGMAGDVRRHVHDLAGVLTGPPVGIGP
jgi:hypothetical protein